jgi:hypothetical protein
LVCVAAISNRQGLVQNKESSNHDSLIRRINPAQKFRITKRQIAKFLRIPLH